jgi:cullin-associated NEDD8-dissociated protein 1
MISVYAQHNTPSESLIETLSILSILISRFPYNLTNANLVPQPLTVLPPLLAHQRPVVRKRTIITLAQFIPISQPELFSELLKSYVYPFLVSSTNSEKQRTTVQLVAAVARHSAGQIAPVLGNIVPGILSAVQKDDDELRESALQVYTCLSLCI